MKFLIALASIALACLGHIEWAYVILGLVALRQGQLWLLDRYGNYTLGCIFGMHDGCDQHLQCGCPHHDEVIHNEMAK